MYDNAHKTKASLWHITIRWTRNGHRLVRDFIVGAKTQKEAEQMVRNRMPNWPDNSAMTIHTKNLGGQIIERTFYSSEITTMSTISRDSVAEIDEVIFNLALLWGCEIGWRSVRTSEDDKSRVYLDKLKNEPNTRSIITKWAEEFLESDVNDSDTFFESKMTQYLGTANVGVGQFQAISDSEYNKIISDAKYEAARIIADAHMKAAAEQDKINRTTEHLAAIAHALANQDKSTAVNLAQLDVPEHDVSIIAESSAADKPTESTEPEKSITEEQPASEEESNTSSQEETAESTENLNDTPAAPESQEEPEESSDDEEDPEFDIEEYSASNNDTVPDDAYDLAETEPDEKNSSSLTGSIIDQFNDELAVSEPLTDRNDDDIEDDDEEVYDAEPEDTPVTLPDKPEDNSITDVINHLSSDDSEPDTISREPAPEEKPENPSSENADESIIEEVTEHIETQDDDQGITQEAYEQFIVPIIPANAEALKQAIATYEMPAIENVMRRLVFAGRDKDTGRIGRKSAGQAFRQFFCDKPIKQEELAIVAADFISKCQPVSETVGALQWAWEQLNQNKKYDFTPEEPRRTNTVVDLNNE